MVEQRSPRIGIIGAGAIGGYYGMLLARAGLDVHFLLRSDYAVVAEQGLQLDSVVHGQLHLSNLQVYADAASMPTCDWLLVGAKTTSNAELAPLLVQIAAPGAKVVLLQNGLAVEEALRPLLPDSLHLLGGLCFICVHRAAAGQIVHQAYGGINLGYHSGPVMARLCWPKAWHCCGRLLSMPIRSPIWRRRVGRSWCGTSPTTGFQSSLTAVLQR